MENYNYCFECNSELKSTGYNHLTEKSYFTCLNCNLDYTVTMTNDYTTVIEIDK